MTEMSSPSFSFEKTSKGKISAEIDDQSYQTLLIRLVMCDEAEAALRPDLLNFTCHVIHNIEWYHDRIKSEYSVRVTWFVASALITLALPLIVYFMEDLLSPSGYSLASAMIASALVWHRTVNTYLSKSRVTTGYRSAASSLKQLLYEFESKWAEVLSTPARTRIFIDDCENDIREVVLEARKFVANEQFDYYENHRPALLTLPGQQFSTKNTGVRTNFLRDKMTQPTTNFRFVGFASDEEDAVLSAHLMGYQTIAGCTNVYHEEKGSLKAAYIKPIIHHKITGSDLGQADLNGSYIGVNLEKLMAPTTPSNELPQTLIHEMMHCAGYGHPPKGPNDSPGDGGDYYNSVPLRAELCIAGLQSDSSGSSAISQLRPTCSQDPADGTFKIS